MLLTSERRSKSRSSASCFCLYDLIWPYMTLWSYATLFCSHVSLRDGHTSCFTQKQRGSLNVVGLCGTHTFLRWHLACLIFLHTHSKACHKIAIRYAETLLAWKPRFWQALGFRFLYFWPLVVILDQAVTSDTAVHVILPRFLPRHHWR